MASPRSLVFQLHKHWDIIEQLCRQSREMPAFEPHQLLALIKHFSADDEPAAILRSLVHAAILEPLGRSDALQLNPLITDFVRGLMHEHELGLSAVLKARVEAIRAASTLVTQGIDNNSMDRLNRGAAQLSELFRQIQQQLEQDLHAILEIAEVAKSRDAAMPLEQRYAQVLEAYDNYVEPMNEMMDSSLGGSFYPHLERATAELDRAGELLAVRGALYTHRLRLRQVAQQAKELRRRGHWVARQCADTLLPLREELRQNNRLSSVVSDLLGQVRKRGLAATLKQQADIPLPGWRRWRAGRIHLGDEVRALMAAAQHFEPSSQAFPEAVMAAVGELTGWVDEAALRRQLEADLPVANLLEWLVQHHPQLPDAVLLRLYHELVREPQWLAELGARAATELSEVRVRYHGHRLAAPL